MTSKEYLDQHSFSPEFLKDRLGWAWDDTKFTIPIYGEDGKNPFNKYRHLTGEAKFTYDKGKHPTLYPLWLIQDKKKLVLCEGEPDCARLWQANIPAVTSVGGVGSLTEEMAQMLSGKEISLALDNDNAGQKNIPKYISLLEKFGISVKIISLPTQYKDVCEYFTDNHQKADFLKLPQDTPDNWLIKKYQDIYPVISNKEFLKTQYPTKKWLIKPLMRATGIIYIVGEGGVGKTLVSYSMIKAITEGTRWLGIYPTTKEKVLILDKENDEIDIQENLIAQQATSPSIFHYTTALDFSFFDQTGNPSQEAMYINAYVKKNKVGVVLMDSLADFFVGGENEAIVAAGNVLAWKQTFPNCAIALLHHENKPQQGEKNRYSGHKLRGSTHLVNAAQSIISLSIPDRDYAEDILVEHTKVRGARKQKPFMIKMQIEDKSNSDPEFPETIVTGFTHEGIVIPQKKAIDKAKEAILLLLANSPERRFATKDVQIELSDKIDNERNIGIALKELRDKNMVANDTSQKTFTYWHLEENLLKEEESPLSVKSKKEVEEFIDDL